MAEVHNYSSFLSLWKGSHLYGDRDAITGEKILFYMMAEASQARNHHEAGSKQRYLLPDFLLGLFFHFQD
jgi:hypothetical protein